MWNRKCHLQSLVEAEIKKVLEETKDSEYQPKEVADRVAATLEPAVRVSSVNLQQCGHPKKIAVLYNPKIWTVWF